MPHSTIVTDEGFRPDDWTGAVTEIAPDTDPESLADNLGAPLVRVDFPSSADGRGFTLARLLRLRGYRGRLRARGLIAPQYAMARRAGFDEVEIDAATAERQPERLWLTRADWRAHDHQAALRR